MAISHENPVDTLLDILSSKDRLSLLDRLNEESAIELQEIASTDTEIARFHHIHLPKLQETGLVEVEDETTVVKRGETFPEVRPLLVTAREYDWEDSR